MRISELEKYGLEKRMIDYYTTKGLITSEGFEPNQKYRIYGEKAIDEVKKIAILRDAGMSVPDIKKALEDPSILSYKKWNDTIRDLQNKKKKMEEHFDKMIRYAEDLRDSSSYTIRFIDDLENPTESRYISGVFAQFNRSMWEYIRKNDSLLDKIQTSPDDIGSLFQSFYVFLQTMEQRYQKHVPYSDADVQSVIHRFGKDIMNSYGVIVYFVCDAIIKTPYEHLDLTDEEAKDYAVFLEMLQICSNWFRESKSISKASCIEDFYSKHEEEILALDKRLGKSSLDGLAEIIDVICKSPEEAIASFEPEEFAEQAHLGFKAGQEAAIGDGGVPDDEAEEFLNYAIESLNCFFANAKQHLHAE